MKKLLTILSLFICLKSFGQTISASSNPVVLAQGSQYGTVTLTASGFSGTVTWTKFYDITQPINTSTWEKSAPPFDNATLTPSGNNNTTCTITGMKQGRWYYSVTNSSGTAYITIDVDAFSAPTNSTLFSNSNTVSSGYSLPSFADYAPYVNYNDRRQDSLAYIGTTGDNNFSLSNGQQHYIFRDALNQNMIDNRMGKWYFSVRDGLPSHNGNGGFSTHAYGTTTFIEEYSTGKTYIFEYKGYVDTKLSSLGISQPNINNNNIFFFENHSLNNASGDVCSGCSPSLALIYCPSDGTIRTYESLTGGSSTGVNGTGAHSTSIPGDTWFAGNAYGNNWNGPVITKADSLYNQAHTFRMTVREGPSGSGAFYKVEMDGKQVYLRTTGQVGQTANHDYPIFGEIYDYNAQLTSPNNSSRHRQISAVMERYGTYIINANNPPIVNAGPAQTLSSGTSSAILDGSYSRDDGGFIASLSWSLVSGPNSPTFGSPGSYTTTVNGLVNGVYIFKLQATDNNNNTSTGTVTVNVSTINLPTVILTNPSNVSITTATSGGNVTSTGGANVTEGVCWSANFSTPTINNFHTTDNTNAGTGSYTSSLTGLLPNTTYYVRAYATNSAGTAYSSNTLSFTTGAPPTGTFQLPGGTNPYTISGQTYFLSTANYNAGGTDYNGVIAYRPNTPYQFNFLYNYVTSDLVGGGGGAGYMLQFGEESTSPNNWSLNNMLISGNYLNWTGGYKPSGSFIEPHGIFAGFNADVIMSYNFLNQAPMALIQKSDNSSGSNQSNTAGTALSTNRLNSGGICFNVVYNPQWSGVNIKGMANTNIYNNTFYQTVVPATAIIDIYDNVNANGSQGTNIFNNIFYSNSTSTLNISVEVVGDTVGLISDYNVFYCTAGAPMFKIGSNTYTFSQWQTLGFDKHSQVLNPNLDANLVPQTPLTFGVSLGTKWQNGLDGTNPGWSISGLPALRAQNGGVNQIGAYILPINGASAPLVSTTSPATNVTSTSATVGGTVTNNNGSAVTASGIIYSTQNVSPNIGSPYTVTTDGNTSTWTSNLSGLLSNTTYYAYAYATNGIGTSFGSQINFTTSQPTVPTIIVSAGNNQSTTLPNGYVTLTASNASGGASPYTYTWTQVTNLAGSFTTNGQQATFNGMVAGTYQFMVTAQDANHYTGTGTVYVTVYPSGTSSLITGLVSYWNLNETSGSAIDVAGGGNNSTTNTATENVTGKISSAYSFSGSTTTPQYIEMGNKTNLSLTTTGTLTAWIYPTQIANPGMIIDKGNAGMDKNGYDFGFNYGNLFYEFADATGGNGHILQGGIPLNGNIVANQWYFVALTWDGSTVSLYLNGGSPKQSLSQTITPVSNVYPFRIGARGDYLGSTLFQGNIDEVGVWNRALTQAEINVLYNSGNGLSYNFQSTSNIPPVANAGIDQTLANYANSTTINGTGTDADGTVASYAWREITGPVAATINPATSNSTGATNVTGLTIAGTYIFELTVTDNLGATGKDTINITAVYPSIPHAVADAKQNLSYGTTSATLTGSGSTDQYGSLTAYNWVQSTATGGTTTQTVSITSPTSVSTTVTGLNGSGGTYYFKLTVTDNQSNSAFAIDTVIIATNGTSTPVAKVINSSINLPSTNLTTTLTDASTDNATITSWTWAQYSTTTGSNATITGNTTQTPTITIPVTTAGKYIFTLTIHDNQNNSSSCYDTVNVLTNTAPTANAGSNQTVYQNSVSIIGSVSGSGITYAWTTTTGTGVVGNPTGTLTPSVTNLSIGLNTFTLTVTDNQGVHASGSVSVTYTTNSATQLLIHNANVIYH